MKRSRFTYSQIMAILKQGEGGIPAAEICRRSPSKYQRSVENRSVSVRLACDAFMISETYFRYSSRNEPEDETVAFWLISLMEGHRWCGFGLCYYYLRNENGFSWNHKRIHREKPETLAADGTEWDVVHGLHERQS